MTRKHYNVIAKDIAEVRRGANDQQKVVIDEIIGRLSALFGDDNPNFDTLRFRAACGL